MQEELRRLIVATANSIGISPVDLATAMSYETGGTFNPTQPGPRTKHGQHRGLIQFGEPQARKYGVDWSNPVESQLGEGKAVARYLTDAGVKPGMGLLDIYSAINAGGVGLYNRSDAAAGGAPGTVADKVNNQMEDHRRKAEALIMNPAGRLGGDSMVARDHSAQIAGQMSVPLFGSMSPFGGGGGSQPPAGIDPNVAQYAFGEDKDSFGDRLKTAGKHFSDAMPTPPRPGPFPGGPSNEQANGLLSLTQSPNALARMLLSKRMG